ncbi:MAG: hypothetical protein JWN76_3778 [Chitinophagaceae bacterium]|nr:hypothetical protein [Chitinophagaceae bacterium]
MRYYLFFLLMMFQFAKTGAAQLNEETKTAIKELKGILENKPFVHEARIYEIYDVAVSGCRLSYKLYITDQDEREGKIYIHRDYALQLPQLNEVSFRAVDSSFYWIVLSVNAGDTIAESILPDKKSKMIPLPVSTRYLSFTGIPVYTNNPKYITAISRLIHICQGANTKLE